MPYTSGSYFGFSGWSVTPFPLIRTRLNVASSPLTITAQSCPFSQVSCLRNTTTSPFRYSGYMLSPLSCRQKYSLPPANMWLGSSSQSMTSSMASIGIPAGIDPSTGTRRAPASAFSPRRSPVATPNTPASASSVSRPGTRLPPSHIATAERDTPSRSARSAWEMLLAVRIARMRSPICFIQSPRRFIGHRISHNVTFVKRNRHNTC